MAAKARKPNVDSLQGDIDRHGSYFKRIFKTLDLIYESIVGSPDGKTEGMRHSVENLTEDVSSLKKLYDKHERRHKREDNKVSEEIAVYDAGIQKSFKLLWIGLAVVCVIAFVGFWLAVGLPGAALKSAASMIYGIIGGVK